MIRKFFIFLAIGAMCLQPINLTLANNPQSVIKVVISDPGYYDGKQITVEGEVERVHHTESGSGNHYTLFKLQDGEDNEVGVYSKGYLQISEGNKLRVTGQFKKEKRAFIYTFKNVIKAKEVEKLEPGNPNLEARKF